MKLNNKSIIIGDVHGCLDELKNLLRKINYSKDDTIYFIGDLIDKGPYSVETVQYVRNLQLETNVVLLLGNHEEKFLRYYHKVKLNPLEAQNSTKADLFNLYIEKFSPEDIEFLMNSYYYYSIPELSLLLIHAGVFPQLKIPISGNFKYVPKLPKEIKNLNLTLMTRYVSAEGKFVGLGENDDTCSYWADVYKGEFGTIIFGALFVPISVWLSDLLFLLMPS